MDKLYVVKGGLTKSKDENKNDSFSLLTYDFKGNVGYIGKRSKNIWRLYTIIGGGTIKVSGGPDWRYHHFLTFEECVIKLREISKIPVEVIENYFNESESTTSADTASELEEENGYQRIPRTDKSILTQFEEKKISLTPGASYKLELYLESLKDKPVVFVDTVVNATVFNAIMNRHEERLNQLRAQLQEEISIIRPEDIPDVD